MKLSKKDKEQLKSRKAEVQSYAPETNLFLVGFCLTTGELLAMKNALESYKEACIKEYGSGLVVGDVFAYLNNALERANIKL